MATEHEAADHITSVIWKQREMDIDAQLAFSVLLSLGPQSLGQCGPHSGWIFLLLNSFGDPVIDAGGCLWSF